MAPDRKAARASGVSSEGRRGGWPGVWMQVRVELRREGRGDERNRREEQDMR